MSKYQPVFKSNMGTTFRLTSIYYSESSKRLFARGLGSNPDPLPQEPSHIELSVLTGDIQLVDILGEKFAGVSWEFSHMEKIR